MAHNKELQELASQLRQPQGDNGVKVAEMMNETNINMTLHSIKRLDLQDGELILELGHGNCGHLAQLLEQKKNLSYYGLEMSVLMQEEAQRLNSQFLDNEQASFYLYDGVHIPFEDNFFDKVFTVNTVYFWDDPRALLAELYRVIKPGGVLNITYAQGDFMKQLPFVEFGFTLYDDEKIKKIFDNTAFHPRGIETQTETVKSKTGETVDRTFTTITMKKK
ncbi:class I SAM-dependent methyltransferase [Sphingobacterium gobiense]|uniref:Class I SAM-dependent methyltransferase n=1 Tax=Sphingobacterium gobiense TaxID=1382456 RepID=A0A2S9JVI9_9SPHI|nr:class I SAM-dependent methyltransferase [Sphingobacterium gobiense]PRD57260.1 class I SAM-dependent methyltransferase [Sphingobacterium gobiense]